jgi:uncharacterized protein (TIGR01777 family)
MRIFITGATGLIGRRVVIDRLERGDQVVLLSRSGARAAKMFAADANRNITVIEGDPAASGPWRQSIGGCDAVIHLAGAGVADHRWTTAYKRTLVSSRIESTANIVAAIGGIPPQRRPRVLLSGSAIGYYGHGGERELDEDAPAGADFLANLCVAWEEQARRVEQLSDGPVRCVVLRTAVVLDDRGGALQKMSLPFRYFIGGPIGAGRQWMSWIHWRDLVGLIDLAIEDSDLRGPLNASSPQPARNREFARVLGNVIGRPSWLPVPRLALRMIMGEVAGSIAVSQRVIPTRATHHGFRFLYPDLTKALSSLLGKSTIDSDDAFRMPTIPGSAPLRPGPPVLHEERAHHASSDALTPADAPIALALEQELAWGSQPPSAVRPVSGRQQLTAPSAAIKLLAVDVDGTLLNSDGSLAHGVIQACRAAERAGCLVVLATARAPRGLRAILQTLDITAPTINYNGALIWNHVENRHVFHEPLSSEVARQITADVQASQPEILIGLDMLDEWVVNRIDPLFDATIDPEHTPNHVGPLEEFLLEAVTKINLMGAPERLQPVREMIRDKFWQHRKVAVFLSDPRLIQITHPLVDKGIALQRIARKMGLKREEVMAIGDASNDLGMIEWAGFSAAVDNAYPAVRQLADVIVPSNDELGVARAIQRYVLTRR